MEAMKPKGVFYMFLGDDKRAAWVIYMFIIVDFYVLLILALIMVICMFITAYFIFLCLCFTYILDYNMSV